MPVGFLEVPANGGETDSSLSYHPEQVHYFPSIVDLNKMPNWQFIFSCIYESHQIAKVGLQN